MASADDVPPIPTPTPEQAVAVVPPVETSPVPPAPIETPAYAPAPPAGPPTTYAPAQPRGLSLASMICGIAGVFLSLFSAGFLPSLAAVILGHIASKRQPQARALSLTGLITGYIGLGISILWGVILVIALIAHGTASYHFGTYGN